MLKTIKIAGKSPVPTSLRGTKSQRHNTNNANLKQKIFQYIFSADKKTKSNDNQNIFGHIKYANNIGSTNNANNTNITNSTTFNNMTNNNFNNSSKLKNPSFAGPGKIKSSKKMSRETNNSKLNKISSEKNFASTMRNKPSKQIHDNLNSERVAPKQEIKGSVVGVAGIPTNNTDLTEKNNKESIVQSASNTTNSHKPGAIYNISLNFNFNVKLNMQQETPSRKKLYTDYNFPNRVMTPKLDSKIKFNNNIQVNTPNLEKGENQINVNLESTLPCLSNKVNHPLKTSIKLNDKKTVTINANKAIPTVYNLATPSKIIN